METLRCRFVIAALLAATLAVHARAQTSNNLGPQDAVFTITAQDLGIEPTDNGRNVGGRLLFGWARYHAGDDPAWAPPAFDDQGWEIASIGLRSDILPQQGWPGIGWFRVRLRIDPSLRNHTLGFVLLHAGAIEAYLDGRLVHRSGTVGTSRAEEVSHVDSVPFVLPLEAGQEHVLALRYSSFVTEGFRTQWHYTGPALYWGELTTMTRHRGFARFNQGIFSAFFLAFALLFWLLYGLYRSERRFLYLSAYYSLLVPLAFLGSQLPFLESPASWMVLVDTTFALVVGTALAMLLLLYAFFYETLPRLFYGFLFFGLATVAAIVVRLEYTIFLLAFLFFANVEVLRIMVVALWRRKRWGWIIGVGIVPGIFITFWEQLGLVGLLPTPWLTSPFNPGLIATLFLASAFAAYVGVRFAEANRGLAAANEALSEANRTLEDRVARRTAALRASQAQLIHAEKMASLGQLTAGVTHEIKNPLNFINNFAQLSTELAGDLRQELTAHPNQTLADAAADLGELLDDLTTNAQKIKEHGQRADGIIRSMLDHARPAAGTHEPTDLHALLDEHIDLCYHGLGTDPGTAPVVFDRDYDETVGSVTVVRQEIGRVVFNLLNNALYAVQTRRPTPSNGYRPTISVSTRRRDAVVEIRIADNGPGIPAALQEKIFEPFYTTKPTGTGTGLGLSLSYDIVTQGHDGTLTVESTEGQGATFVISLPAETAIAPVANGVVTSPITEARGRTEQPQLPTS